MNRILKMSLYVLFLIVIEHKVCNASLGFSSIRYNGLSWINPHRCAICLVESYKDGFKVLE